MKNRRDSRQVIVGGIQIGGGAAVSVQSMTNARPDDFDAVIAQTRALGEAGCDLIRITIPNTGAAEVIRRIKAERITSAPIVADIHFDYKTALASVAAGVDKIRINPGNIGAEWKVRELARACSGAGIPIRIGVNGGSLERELLEKHTSPTPAALLESALGHAELLEGVGFSDIVISIKASNVAATVEANRLLAAACDYPIHIGLTEAGTERRGFVKNAAAIGALLCDGIGDTIRVSLTADPLREVEYAREILTAMGEGGGMDIICCPTCGRTRIDLIELAKLFEERAAADKIDKLPLKIALMGCAVNGPGEAREADIGIAGGAGEALLFRHGEIIGKLPCTDNAEAVELLICEIKKLQGDILD